MRADVLMAAYHTRGPASPSHPDRPALHQILRTTRSLPQARDGQLVRAVVLLAGLQSSRFTTTLALPSTTSPCCAWPRPCSPPPPSPPPLPFLCLPLPLALRRRRHDALLGQVHGGEGAAAQHPLQHEGVGVQGRSLRCGCASRHLRLAAGAGLAARLLASCHRLRSAKRALGGW